VLLPAADVFAVHGVGGTVGMILTALFSTVTANSAAIDGALYGNPMELAKVLLVLVIIVPWFFAATWACLWVTDKILTLRVSGE
jgi:Amt family ammonium transporter